MRCALCFLRKPFETVSRENVSAVLRVERGIACRKSARFVNSYCQKSLLSRDFVLLRAVLWFGFLYCVEETLFEPSAVAQRKIPKNFQDYLKEGYIYAIILMNNFIYAHRRG